MIDIITECLLSISNVRILKHCRLGCGQFGVNIKPDQVQASNALLVLIMIPIFESLIYPFLGKFDLLTKCALCLAIDFTEFSVLYNVNIL